MGDERRNHRKAQLELLSKTINGRERILRDYQTSCGPGSENRTDQPSMTKMIEAILNAEFPRDGDQ